jgi:hypothetical protein
MFVLGGVYLYGRDPIEREGYRPMYPLAGEFPPPYGALQQGQLNGARGEWMTIHQPQWVVVAHYHFVFLSRGWRPLGFAKDGKTVSFCQGNRTVEIQWEGIAQGARTSPETFGYDVVERARPCS